MGRLWSLSTALPCIMQVVLQVCSLRCSTEALSTSNSYHNALLACMHLARRACKLFVYL
jgi:hypothetical protein